MISKVKAKQELKGGKHWHERSYNIDYMYSIH